MNIHFNIDIEVEEIITLVNELRGQPYSSFMEDAQKHLPELSKKMGELLMKEMRDM